MFQETHLPNDITLSKVNESLKNSRFFINGGSDHSAGVAFNIPVPDNQILTYTPSSINSHENNPRLITCRINWCSKPITLVNIYAPSGSKNTARALFFKEVLIRLSELPGPYIIGGDFNCVLDPKLDIVDYKTNLHKTGYSDQNALIDIIIKFNLTDIWRKFNPDVRMGTHGNKLNPDKISKDRNSRLDRFYVSEELTSLIKSCDIIFDNTSDHSPVCLTLISPEEYKLFKPSWRLNAHLLNSKSFNHKIKKLLKEFIDKNKDITIDSYNRLNKTIIAIAKKWSTGQRFNAKKDPNKLRSDLNNMMSMEHNPTTKDCPSIHNQLLLNLERTKREIIPIKHI